MNTYPDNLLDNGLANPLAVAGDTASLSWNYPSQLAAGAGNIVIEVSRDHVASPGELETITLPLGAIRHELPIGPTIPAGRVEWRVGIESRGVIEWSPFSYFEVALQNPLDWDASWITDPTWLAETLPHRLPMLSRTFYAPSDSAEARLRLAAAGVADVQLNGHPVSADLLVPGYSTLPDRVPAVCWDVTDLLQAGVNTVTVTLAAGMAAVERPARRYTKLESDFLRPRFLLRLDAVTTGDRKALVVSDDEWVSGDSNTLYSHWYGGEDGLGGPSTNTGTRPGHVLGAADLHKIWWPKVSPVREIERLEPVAVTAIPGAIVADFGVNIAGRQELTLIGATAGSIATMRPAEVVDSAGAVDQWSTGSPIWDSLTASGSEVEKWSPRFTYHGFRYLQVEADPEVLAGAAVTARVMHADNRRVGDLELDDPTLQQLHSIIVRAIRGNMFSVFTDCPHREKLGWIEQLHLCFNAIARNFDVLAHMRDELTHIAASQLASGAIPNIAPEFADFTGHGFRGDPNAFREDVNWGASVVLVPWKLYREYADRQALVETWPTTKKYLEYLHTRQSDGLLDFGLGDWVALDPSTPRWLVASTGYLDVLEAAVRVASILEDEDEDEYRNRLTQTANAVRSRFSRERHDLRSQGALALALHHALVERDDEVVLLDLLMQEIQNRGYQFTVGENALPALISVLHGAGMDETLHRMVVSPDVPGYGWQLAQGATSLGETWTLASGDEGEGSQNHFMLSMIHDWLHGDLAGLRQHPDSVGWEKLHIRPTFLPGLGSARTQYDTVRGRAAVSWRRSSEGVTVTVTVPQTATALLELPHQDLRELGPGDWTFEVSPLTRS
jgi:alpha-L-rhamnosidase